MLHFLQLEGETLFQLKDYDSLLLYLLFAEVCNQIRNISMICPVHLGSSAVTWLGVVPVREFWGQVRGGKLPGRLWGGSFEVSEGLVWFLKSLA